MIKTYANEADYKAAEKSKTESTVGLIESSNRVVIDGVNVVTDNPGVGDILCYDENRKYKFIQLDTFQAGTFPAAWETLGVVAMRKGNLVWVVAKENASKKFMDVYPYVVSGYELDGAEQTARLKLHGSETFEFRYTASTDEEFLAALKSFLTTNNFADWSAYIKDSNVILQYDNYTSSEYLSASITQATGITLKAECEMDMPLVPSAKRKCGISGYPVWNIGKAKEYFMEDNQNASFNPDSDLDTIPVFPICWPAFAGTSQYQDDHCLYLRQRYCKDPDNPTLAEWERYIDDLAPVNPAMTGGFEPEFRDWDTFDRIKKITYIAADGMEKPLYPGANYCSKFFDGKGYMSTGYDLYEMLKNITYGVSGVARDEADPINRSLAAIGGSSVGANGMYWTCDRFNYSGAFNFNNMGYIGTSVFYSARTCIPLCFLGLSKTDL